jgi:hypothetical protein
MAVTGLQSSKPIFPLDKKPDGCFETDDRPGKSGVKK